MSLTHLLRTVSFLGTGSFNFLLNAPIELLTKILKKFGIKWGRRSTSRRNQSAAKTLIKQGKLSEGISLLQKNRDELDRGDHHLLERTIERVEQLDLRPPRSTGKTTRRSELRVLHVLTNSKPYTRSGYTVRSHNIVKSQLHLGTEVAVATRPGYPLLNGKIAFSPVQSIDGVNYSRLVPFWLPKSLKARDAQAVRMIVAHAQSFNASVLHTTTDFKNAIVVSRAAEILGIPWVYEVRGEPEKTWLASQPENYRGEAELSEFYTMSRAQETRYMEAADAVVVLSDISKQGLIQRGVPAGKIHVIPNAVEDELIGRSFDRSLIRTELGFNVDDTLIGAVTAVVDYEGLDFLIEALLHLAQDVKAVIVGDGVARDSLEARARELNLEDRINFVGYQPDAEIWKWYAMMDVVVVPRKDTPVCRTVTPIKPMIAMALNIPLVTSDLPALREVTGNQAMYVAPEDGEALANGINSALTRPSRPRTDWIEGRTWSRNAQRYMHMYSNL